jgi:8-oxo-dGTP pyrophosphatase MutT (NUDIX family)
MFCNNCGKEGHVFKTCKSPITSTGILLLRGPFEPLELPAGSRDISILMVKRKDSMTFVEFVRGKYNVHDIEYLKNLFMNMTEREHKLILNSSFDDLWTGMWGVGRDIKSKEYEISSEKFSQLDLKNIVNQSSTKFTQPEWGFPKGKRSRGEDDISCAIREFEEETNIKPSNYTILPNIVLIEEFTGTNNSCYKHIYFIALLKTSQDIYLDNLTPIQLQEVSKVEWKTLSKCREITRPHYTDRLRVLKDLERIITTYKSLDSK